MTVRWHLNPFGVYDHRPTRDPAEPCPRCGRLKILHGTPLERMIWRWRTRKDTPR